jgi:hypothetical protein
MFNFPFYFNLLTWGNLSSIALFEDYAKEVGEEVVEAADIETDKERDC